MKKTLLATTGLFGAALLSAAAFAETPKVTVGGNIDFQAGTVDEDLDASTQSHGFRNDTEVSVRVDGKSANGLGYGAVIALEADVSGDADNQGLNASRTYVYLDGGWGRFELGSQVGASQTLSVGAESIAAATGGINGAWTYFANPTGQNFIATPDLPLALGNTTGLGDESTENATKINYYSPRMSGVQLGLSYTPNSSDRGQTLTRNDTTAGEATDIIDAALNYEGQFDMVKVGAAATGQWGESKSAAQEDINAWNVGGMLGYMGFSIAASYGDLGDSLNTSSRDSEYYTLGAAYETGPFAASVTYLESELETGATTENEFDNLVFGADYKLAPGLTPYAEVSIFDFDAAGTASDNEGTALIVGTQLAF